MVPPHAPRSSSLNPCSAAQSAAIPGQTSSESSSALAEQESLRSVWSSLAQLSQTIYTAAVQTTPPIYSDSDSEEEVGEDVELLMVTLDERPHKDKQEADVEELTINEQEIRKLLQTLNRENNALALNPRTIMASNGSINAQPETLLSLTSFYNSQSNQQYLPEDPAIIEFWAQFLASDAISQLSKLPHLIIAKTRSTPIPPHLRGQVWAKLCCADGNAISDFYNELLEKESNASKLIERDIGRTFPHSEMFKEEGGEGQRKLFRVLKAYSVYDSKVEYCQGLSFCVGPLLMQKMGEQDAFAVLLKLMGRIPNHDTLYQIPNHQTTTPSQSRKFGIRSMFTPDMSGLHLALFQHSALLQQYLPRLAAHFEACHITATMYASQWFLTLFSYSVPLALVFRIFDLIFAEGALVTLMRISISLLKKNETILLSQPDLESLMANLKGTSLLGLYREDYDRAIKDATDLSHTISYKVLEDLKTKYRLEEGRYAITLTRQELENLQLEIGDLQETVSKKEGDIKRLTMSSSLYEAESRLLSTQLNKALAEKAALEKEACLLRKQLQEDRSDLSASNAPLPR